MSSTHTGDGRSPRRYPDTQRPLILPLTGKNPASLAVELSVAARKMESQKAHHYYVRTANKADLTDFLNQRDRDYCIGMISYKW
jgi:hypothetical protein